LKIEAAVDQGGRVVAVRCRAALDVGVEAVFEGTAPGYRLERTAGVGAEAAEKTATDAEATLDERRGGWREVKKKAAGWSVFWRR